MPKKTEGKIAIEKAIEHAVAIAVIDTRVKNLEVNIEKIMTNHLPHLQAEVESVKLRMAYIGGGLAVFITLLEIALKVFF